MLWKNCYVQHSLDLTAERALDGTVMVKKQTNREMERKVQGRKVKQCSQVTSHMRLCV